MAFILKLVVIVFEVKIILIRLIWMVCRVLNIYLL